MEPQWGGEKSLKAEEKDHTLTDRVCAFKTSWAECRDQKRCRHRANGGDFSLDIHSYRTILAAVGLLLLIGCGNVANLMLARATSREKEFALRAVLGAGRRRLVRLLLVESLVLAIGGAALGVLIAWGGLKLIVAAMPQNLIPAESVIELNAPVMVFTLVVAVLTALIFGLAPALRAARRDLNDPLLDRGKGVIGGLRTGRMLDMF